MVEPEPGTNIISPPMLGAPCPAAASENALSSTMSILPIYPAIFVSQAPLSPLVIPEDAVGSLEYRCKRNIALVSEVFVFRSRARRINASQRFYLLPVQK